MVQLQQGVLFRGPVKKEAYGDHVVEVKFAQPVQITSISITSTSHGMAGEKTMFRGGWARDLFSASAARFVSLFPAIPTVPSHSVAATEAFATDHLVLHGKFHSVLVTISGYVLPAAAQQIKVAAEKQLGSELPTANPGLSIPTKIAAGIKQQQDPDQQSMPQLQLSQTSMLPMAKLPAVFVRALVSGVHYWRQVRLSHSRIERNPPNGRLDRLTALADAVLAAIRGQSGALQMLLASASVSEAATAAHEWPAVQDDALDMAASWSSMLASCRTHTPFDMEVGVAGLAASILLASCTVTAAQYLALMDARQELAGAAAVRGVICTPNAPPLISRYGLGLLELLLSSCPAVACATLLGPYTPVLASSPQQQHAVKQEPDGRSNYPQPNGGLEWNQGTPVKAEANYSSGQQNSQGAGKAAEWSHRSSGRGRPLGLVKQGSLPTSDGAPPPPRLSAAPAAAEADTHADDMYVDEESYQHEHGMEQHDAGAADDGDSDGLYAELGSGELQQADQQGSDLVDAYDDINHEQEGAEGVQDGEAVDTGGYADIDPEQSEENLQLDDEDDVYGESAQEYATYDDVHDHEMADEDGQPTAAAAGGGETADCDTGMPDGSQNDEIPGHSGFGNGPVRGSHELQGSEQRMHSHGTAGAGGGSGRGYGAASGRNRHSTASHDQHERIHKHASQGRDSENRRYGMGQRGEGGSTGQGWSGMEDSAVIAPRRDAKILARRRTEAVELYSGVVALAMQARREDIADSCSIVLRRLKCWECISVLRSTLDPMLDGTTNPLLLPTQDFQQQMHKVSIAVSDMAELVLLPHPQGPVYHTTAGDASSANGQQQQRSGRSGSTGLRQADACVLQLLLSFRVMELLAALVDLAAVHGSRLAQQQQAADGQQPQSAAQQLSSLRQEQSQLLASIQVLVSSLTSSAAGWEYCRAAWPGLAALSQAINPNTQAHMDGGPLDVRGPLDPVSGRLALRQQLLLGTCGPAAVSSSNASAELSMGLQRILLLARAVGELQQQQTAAGSKSAGVPGSSKAAAAVQTLVQCCLSSVVGREAAVCALASSAPAVKHLISLLSSRVRVLTAAAGEAVQDEAASELAGLLDADDDPLAGGFGAMISSTGSSTAPKPLAYESLYVPDLLLALLAEPHPDIIQQWLPEADAVAAAVADELRVQDRHGAAAAAAAFPADSKAGVGDGLDSQASWTPKGLDLSAEPGVSAAAFQRQRSVLLQIQGFALAAQQLLISWKCGDGSGTGSGTCLVTQLQQLLPPLVAVNGTRSSPGLATADSGNVADIVQEPVAATGNSTSSTGSAVQGAATVAGAPPPWGRDVGQPAAVQFVMSAQDLSSALSSLNLLTMLLQGPSAKLRMLIAAAADRPTERAALKPALNPAVALNPNGALGPGGTSDSWAGGLAVQDGLASQVLVSELLENGVLDVLERALRTATCALEASTSDFLWGVRGGDCMDDLERVRGRASAASLLLSAASAAAALMVLMAEADVSELSGCSLLDSITCAHIAVVTSQEGLAATLPTPPLLTHLAAATADPTSTSAAAAAAAAARRGAGRCQDLLLQARQQLAVCLCCWQRCGWWPDCVGALLGHYPKASEALQQIATEEAELKAKGEKFLVSPAPRQGPRQLLAALLALGDVCPAEWPPPGASQAVAAATDAADAGGWPRPAVAFDRPSHMQLRSKIAGSCESHMAALAELVSWGAMAESKLVRAALVRLCVRAGSLGGGMGPFLVPLLLAVLREQLEAAIKEQQQLRSQLNKLAAQGQGAAAQQRALQAMLPNAPQLSDGRRVIELLIPLASKPGFKAALLEHKVVGMLAKYLHKLSLRSKEEPDSGTVIELVLQLLAALCNPDVSLSPNAPRWQREQEDTPLLRDGRDMVAAILASAQLLNADNMAAAASLLLGPCAAAGGKGLAQYSRGQAALRQGVLRWFQSQSPDSRNYLTAEGFTAEALPSAISWAAGRLTDTAEQSGHPSHKAACLEVAAALRQLPQSAPPETEVDPTGRTITRFAKAVQEAVGAPNQSSTASEDLGALLEQPAILLACDVTAADFLAVTYVGSQSQRQKMRHAYALKRDSAAAPLTSLFGGDGLVPPKRPRTQSRPVQWLQAYVSQGGAVGAAVGRPARLRVDSKAAALDEAPEGVPNIPVITAPRRSAAVFKMGSSSRKASMHVDDYQAQKPGYNPLAASPSTAAAGPGGAGSGVPVAPAAGLPAPLPGRAPVSAGPSPRGSAGGPPGGPGYSGSGKIMRPGPPAPQLSGGGSRGMANVGVQPGALVPGMAMPMGMMAGPMGASPTAVAAAAVGMFPGPPVGRMPGQQLVHQQGMPAAPALQQQGSQPSDPRQHQQRPPKPQQYQQPPQQQNPLVTDLQRSESPTGGSDLLGGLAGDSPDYGNAGSPSYHSSPDSAGGGAEQEWQSDMQQDDDISGYRVSYA